MRESWRWFGPQDPVTLRDIRQAGATDIVTALHHIPCGELWTETAIAQRKRAVEWDAERNRPTGLRWSVVESVPVHEDIKTRSGDFRERIATYKRSLENLARLGLTTVCYNFMPVLDWTRSDLDHELEDGSRVLLCDVDALAAFDLFILKRPGAVHDHGVDGCARAQALFERLDEAGRQRLTDAILLGLPGTVDGLTIDNLRAALGRYAGIGRDRLRQNLHDFLDEIMPTCERLGIRMAIHPDDPPRPLFGLPRIMSTADDVDALFAAIPSASCGLTLCSGSFGGRIDNDPAAMFARFAPRIHFVHFRNVAFVPGRDGVFHESGHLDGDVDMARAMLALIREEDRRHAAGFADWSIPVRPDHGRLFDRDAGDRSYAGYSFTGRLVGLAELRGLEHGLRHALGAPSTWFGDGNVSRRQVPVPRSPVPGSMDLGGRR